MLTVFSDYVCPFSYLAEALLEQLRRGGAEITHRAYELWPYPMPLPTGSEPELDALWEGTILPLARAMKVDARRPERIPRSRKAHEAARFARRHGRFLDYHRAVFRGHFVEGRDIGRVDELVEIGGSLGLDATALKIALDIDEATAAVEADLEAARGLGITGTPAFVTASEVVLGLQPLAVLRQLLAAGEAAQDS